MIYCVATLMRSAQTYSIFMNYIKFNYSFCLVFLYTETVTSTLKSFTTEKDWL